MPEELRFGYISPNLYFNLFHAGFCAPYIANPNYLLLVDFRTRYPTNIQLFFISKSAQKLDF